MRRLITLKSELTGGETSLRGLMIQSWTILNYGRGRIITAAKFALTGRVTSFPHEVVVCSDRAEL